MVIIYTTYLLFCTHCIKPFRCYAKILLTYWILFCVVPSNFFCIFVTPTTSISYSKGNMASRWVYWPRIILRIFSRSPPSSSNVVVFRSIFTLFLVQLQGQRCTVCSLGRKYYIFRKYRFTSVVREFIAIARLKRENPIKTGKSTDLSPSFSDPYSVRIHAKTHGELCRISILLQSNLLHYFFA